MRKTMIFVGGVGNTSEFVGGELTKNKNLLEQYHKLGGKAYVVDTYGARKNPLKIVKLPLFLILHPSAPVLVSTNLGNIYWFFRLLSMLKSKRVVSFVGTGGAFTKWIVEGKYNPKYLHFLHVIVVQGEVMAKDLDSVGLNRHIVLPNSKIIRYLPDLDKLQKKSTKAEFVFVSRMRDEKGLGLIIRSCQEINDMGLESQYSVTFYGSFEDISYERFFMSEISTFNNLKYNGVLNLRTNVGYDELSKYDVMLFPTYWPGEGFPGVVIDSLIAGLPIIISDWNFNSDLVENNKTGFVIPSLNQHALTEIMLKIINDVSACRNMSSYCQEIALQYDTRMVINEKLFSLLGI